MLQSPAVAPNQQVREEQTIGFRGSEFHSYKPNSKQWKFRESPAKYKAMIGAFRSGKTYAACFEAIQLSLAFPGNTGLICRKDYTTLKDSTMATFFSIIPKNSPLVHKWNETSHDLWLKSPFGPPSLIMFRGAEEYLQFGSYELGWFWMDQAEQMNEPVFKMLQSRLSKNNVRLCGMITPNPPNQFHWIYRTFKNADPTEKFVIHTSTYDNREYLPEGYIEEMEKQPENWKKMYLHGEYGFMAEGDPVYAEFRSSLHIAKNPLQVIRDVTVIRSWDFGYRSPSCGFYQISPTTDRVYKLAELVGEDIIIDRFADRVLNLSALRFVGSKFLDCGDPAGLQKNDKSEKTSIEILADKGIRNFKCQRTFINDGVNLIRRALIPRDDGVSAYLIDPSCRITEEAYLGGYFMKEGADAPDDKCHPYCDVADTDRYLFVNFVPVRKLEAKKPQPHKKTVRSSATGY